MFKIAFNRKKLQSTQKGTRFNELHKETFGTCMRPARVTVFVQKKQNKVDDSAYLYQSSVLSDQQFFCFSPHLAGGLSSLVETRLALGIFRSAKQTTF